MNEKHRFIIFVEWSKRVPANNAMKALDRNPEDRGDLTFGSVRLSPTGEDPATYSACNTAADDDYKAGILTALSNVPFAAVYDANEFTYDEALIDMGLKRIEEDII